MGATWKPRKKRNPHRLVLVGDGWSNAVPMGTPRGGTVLQVKPEYLKAGEYVVYSGREWKVETRKVDQYTLVCGDGRTVDIPTATAGTMLFRGHMAKVS
jgi:hypothetical protein